MELVEVGPSMDLVVRRHRLPAQDLEKEAMKAPGHAKKVNPM
jgi:ribosome production factor 2